MNTSAFGQQQYSGMQTTGLVGLVANKEPMMLFSAALLDNSRLIGHMLDMLLRTRAVLIGPCVKPPDDPPTTADGLLADIHRDNRLLKQAIGVMEALMEQLVPKEQR